MGCEILDFRCVLVNELIGSTILTIIIAAIFYFIIASKMKFGFDTTIALSIPILLLLGIVFTGFSAIYAFATIIVGILLAWIFNKIIGN